MNDIFELWSLPWHALQHSLALSFGAEEAAATPGAPPYTAARPSTATRVIATPTSSWLVRALSVTAQPASARTIR